MDRPRNRQHRVDKANGTPITGEDNKSRISTRSAKAKDTASKRGEKGTAEKAISEDTTTKEVLEVRRRIIPKEEKQRIKEKGKKGKDRTIPKEAKPRIRVKGKDFLETVTTVDSKDTKQGRARS